MSRNHIQPTEGLLFLQGVHMSWDIGEEDMTINNSYWTSNNRSKNTSSAGMWRDDAWKNNIWVSRQKVFASQTEWCIQANNWLVYVCGGLDDSQWMSLEYTAYKKQTWGCHQAEYWTDLAWSGEQGGDLRITVEGTLRVHKLTLYSLSWRSVSRKRSPKMYPLQLRTDVPPLNHMSLK